MAIQQENDRQEVPASRWPLLLPSFTVFVASFCIMVLELVAARLIARHLGSSLYTWTSVIGIVLAGITLGNLAGGRLADRYPARSAPSGGIGGETRYWACSSWLPRSPAC